MECHKDIRISWNVIRVLRVDHFGKWLFNQTSPRISAVPKMEGFPEPYKAILGWVFPYISRIHTAYIGEDSSILGT